jgi:hypothetical protein
MSVTQRHDGHGGFRRAIEIVLMFVVGVLILAFYWFLATHSGLRD